MQQTKKPAPCVGCEQLQRVVTGMAARVACAQADLQEDSARLDALEALIRSAHPMEVIQRRDVVDRVVKMLDHGRRLGALEAEHDALREVLSEWVQDGRERKEDPAALVRELLEAHVAPLVKKAEGLGTSASRLTAPHEGPATIALADVSASLLGLFKVDNVVEAARMAADEILEERREAAGYAVELRAVLAPLGVNATHHGPWVCVHNAIEILAKLPREREQSILVGELADMLGVPPHERGATSGLELARRLRELRAWSQQQIDGLLKSNAELQERVASSSNFISIRARDHAAAEMALENILDIQGPERASRSLAELIRLVGTKVADLKQQADHAWRRLHHDAVHAKKAAYVLCEALGVGDSPGLLSLAQTATKRIEALQKRVRELDDVAGGQAATIATLQEEVGVVRGRWSDAEAEARKAKDSEGEAWGDKAASDHALDEANERIAELERQLQEAQQA